MSWVGTEVRFLLPSGFCLLLWLLVFVSPATAETWLCDGDPITVERTTLAQDAIGPMAGPIPNSADGTLPGDGIVLRWRDLTLQLPRTNNSGAPSYTDGRWWWKVDDPDHPEFRQRRGSIVTYACERQVAEANPRSSRNS